MSESALRLASEEYLATEERTRTVGTNPQQVQFQQIAEAHVGVQPLALEKYLATSGDSIEMAVASGTFDLTPGADDIYRVEELVLLMSLATSPTLLEFGDLAAIATGLTLKVLDTDGATIVDLLDGQPIKANNDLATIGKLELITLGATYSLRVTIPTRVRLEGADSEKLRIVVADDISTLTRFRCLARGRQEHTLT